MLATWKCGSVNPERSAFRSTVRRLPSVASGQYYGNGAIEAGCTLARVCFGPKNGVHFSYLLNKVGQTALLDTFYPSP